LNKFMAENIPSLPGGAVPPKPPEGSKIQPKKETVRINLPPKPSAAPTIKLPTLPPGGPSAGAPVFSVPSHAAPAAPAASMPRPMQRPAAPVAPAINSLDRVLIIAAAVAGLLAVGSTVYCMTLIK
jgi:hypothetical protein